MENNKLEVNCKHYVSERDFCGFYKKAHPPIKVCEMCNNFEPCEVIRDCSKFKSYFEDFCINTNGYEIIYRKKPEACSYCQWPENGRFDLFDIKDNGEE